MRRLLLVAALLFPCIAAGSETRTLPFVEDDYGRALDLARHKKLPLFVDSWAPW
jgi:hypothetical protein